MSAVLVLGTLLIGGLYFLDQYRDPAPSMINRAIQAAEAAVRQNPNTISARFALGQAYADVGRFDDAIGQFNEILKASPKNASVLLERGRTEVLAGRTDAAAADFRTVIDTLKTEEMAKVDPGLESAYFNLASIQVKTGHPKDAVANLLKALSINSTDADAYNLIGIALLQTGDASAATGAFRRAVALVPTDWCDPYSGMSQAFAAQKDADGVAYANGMFAVCQKRYDEAEPLLKAQVSGKYGVEALVGLGLMFESRGDSASASTYYAQALLKDQTNFLATTGLARTRAGVAVPSASPSATASPQS